ncbi:MAG TPA: twin-arginine translocation signal domain-containing protein, partial [Prolixibacteraceae bacterium]|nr:twin-arginine translocation signal domain-containing protein [Prolixibacteraceae bacterium]
MKKLSWSRRKFIKTAGLAGTTIASIPNITTSQLRMNPKKEIKIDATSSNFEREPLIRPFGFKGGYMTEIWQTAAWLKSASGTSKVGLCTQNVLWSDAKVFGDFSEAGGNSLMYSMTDYALHLLKGISYN